MTLSCRKRIISIIKRNTIKKKMEKNGDFYCLICLHYFKAKNKLESHKRVRKNKDFCNVIMPTEDTEILEINKYQKSDKAPFIIYADLECIAKQIDGCKNNPAIHLQQK